MRYFIALLMLTTALSTSATETEDDHSKQQGWIGARYVSVADSTYLRRLLPGAPRLVIVDSIERDSPAATAGLEVGDCIRAIDDVDFKSVRTLAGHVRRSTPGENQTFYVQRDGIPRTIEVVIGEQQVKRTGRLALGIGLPSLKAEVSLSERRLDLFDLIYLGGAQPQTQGGTSEGVRRYRRGKGLEIQKRRELFRLNALVLHLDLTEEVI